MPMLRAPRSFVSVAVLIVATLTGCLGPQLAPAASKTPPSLQGVWRLNRTASDDPQKIIDKLKAEAEKKIRRALNAPPPSLGDSNPRRRGQGGGAAAQPSPDDLQAEPPPQQGPGMDPLRNSPTMHELRNILQRSDYLTIKQSPDQISFDSATTVRSYTPGEKSVVSSENGVADQTSGWDDRKYKINIKPQLGPRVVEEYSLSADGKQLIVKSIIGPFELSKVELTRVYDATGQAVPNSAPSND